MIFEIGMYTYSTQPKLYLSIFFKKVSIYERIMIWQVNLIFYIFFLKCSLYVFSMTADVIVTGLLSIYSIFKKDFSIVA